MTIAKLERKADTGTVKMLKDLLAEAESGKILGIVLISNDAESYYRTWEAGHFKVPDVMYSFEVWKGRRIRRAEEE